MISPQKFLRGMWFTLAPDAGNFLEGCEPVGHGPHWQSLSSVCLCFLIHRDVSLVPFASAAVGPQSLLAMKSNPFSLLAKNRSPTV